MADWHFKLFVVIAILGLVGAFAVIVWLNRMISAHIKQKYTWVVLMKCKFPFFPNWEEGIDAEDIAAFQKYRKVFLSWNAVALILIILEFVLMQQIIGGTQ